MAQPYDDIILQHIQDSREILKSVTDRRLIKSRISTEDYFSNLSYGPPALPYPEVGISKTVVSICELISNALFEDSNEEDSMISKAIVMIFEYYFLVAPVLFEGQEPRINNDLAFMKHFMRYIQSLCKSKTQVQKELCNLLISLEIYNPIKGT